MEASARKVVELASSDYELSDVSDRSTDVPVPPTLPPLDLDTTQIVPKLVLSELRYQARLQSNPGAAALAANDAAAIAHAPPPAPAPRVDAAVETTIEATEEPTRSGLGRAVAAGVALGVVAVGLVAGVFALVY